MKIGRMVALQHGQEARQGLGLADAKRAWVEFAGLIGPEVIRYRDLHCGPLCGFATTFSQAATRCTVKQGHLSAL